MEATTAATATSVVAAAKQPVIGLACNYCRLSHTACEAQRPCRRCQKTGRAHLCSDVPLRKRGRPRKADQETGRPALSPSAQQAADDGSTPAVALADPISLTASAGAHRAKPRSSKQPKRKAPLPPPSVATATRTEAWAPQQAGQGGRPILPGAWAAHPTAPTAARHAPGFGMHGAESPVALPPQPPRPGPALRHKEDDEVEHNTSSSGDDYDGVTAERTSTNVAIGNGNKNSVGNGSHRSTTAPSSRQQGVPTDNHEVLSKLNLLTSMVEMMAGEMREMRHEHEKLRAKMRKVVTKVKGIKVKQTQADLRSSLAFAQLQQPNHHQQHQHQHLQYQHQHQHEPQPFHGHSQQLASNGMAEPHHKRRRTTGNDRYYDGDDEYDAVVMELLPQDSSHSTIVPLPLVPAHSRSIVEEVSRVLPFLAPYDISEHSFVIRDISQPICAIVFRSVYDRAPPLFVYVNAAFANMLGFTCGELLGCSINELCVTNKSLVAQFASLCINQRPMSVSAVFSMTPLFRRKDGRTLRALQNMQFFYDDAGQTKYVLTNVLDWKEDKLRDGEEFGPWTPVADYLPPLTSPSTSSSSPLPLFSTFPPPSSSSSSSSDQHADHIDTTWRAATNHQHHQHHHQQHHQHQQHAAYEPQHHYHHQAPNPSMPSLSPLLDDLSPASPWNEHFLLRKSSDRL